MAFLSILVGILVFWAVIMAVVVGFDIGGGGGGMDMEEEELFGLFEVMGSLLEDPTWAQMHPFPCSQTPWPGVECELLQQSSIFHVTKIHIGPDVMSPPCKPSAKISGSITKLPYLKTLSLISCFTNSPLVLNKSLFGSLQFLEHLSLESNPSLTGEIPSTISNLGNLKLLRVSENNLIGRIPKEIGELVNLQQLDLSHNNFTGPIPEEIGDLGDLAILDLSWNFLGKNVPGSIGRLGFLEKVDLSFNQLDGDLPEEMGGLKRLVLMDLSHNSLTGQIPDDFSGLQRLEYLIMDGNPLNSSFPSLFGSLSKLSVLSLSGCGLTGPISTTFSNLTSLTALSLDNNRLNGSVPAQLGLLPSLDLLNLSRNQLTGELLFSGYFINRLGERLDFRENSGLCMNYEDGSLQNPVCSTSRNKTLGDDDRGEDSMKPKVYGDVKSSNVHGVEEDNLFLVWFLGPLLFMYLLFVS